MYLRITGDIDGESGVEPIIYDLSGPTEKHFSTKEYGAGMLGLAIILMCQDPSLNLKQRVRLHKKERKLYMDVMLDLPTMKAARPQKRRNLVLQRVQGDLAETLAKYNLPDFDRERFLKDLKTWFDSIA